MAIRRGMPTKKQRIAFKKVMEGESLKAAMLAAGYTEATAHLAKQNLTSSEGWKVLMEEQLTDEFLMKVHQEGLMATEQRSMTVEIISVDGKKVNKIKNIKVPDYAVRHRYLDTAYKIRNKYPQGSSGVGVAVQVNIDKAREEYSSK